MKSHIIKKIIVLNSTILATACTVAMSSCNEQAIHYNWDGTNWKGYESGSLTIVPTNEINKKECQIILNDHYTAHNLVIPQYIWTPEQQRYKIIEAITWIDWTLGKKGAFMNSSLSGSLTIPSGIKLIDNDGPVFTSDSSDQVTSIKFYGTQSNTYPFEYNSTLQSLIMPNVTSLPVNDTKGTWPSGYTQLKYVDIRNVTSMAAGSFENDTNLTSIHMDSLMTLDLQASPQPTAAFLNCANLSEIYWTNITSLPSLDEQGSSDIFDSVADTGIIHSACPGLLSYLQSLSRFSKMWKWYQVP